VPRPRHGTFGIGAEGEQAGIAQLGNDGVQLGVGRPLARVYGAEDNSHALPGA
jgi:hypothetical protein